MLQLSNIQQITPPPHLSIQEGFPWQCVTIGEEKGYYVLNLFVNTKYIFRLGKNKFVIIRPHENFFMWPNYYEFMQVLSKFFLNNLQLIL